MPEIRAQSQQEQEEQYQWFDQLVGVENTALYNGIGYTEKFRVINEYHKFFKTTDFLSGYINYDRQHYPVLEMKYDLDADELLVNLKNGQRIVLLQPIKDRISTFQIDGHRFIHVKDSVALASNISGFYEVLWEDKNLKLLERHYKKRFKKEGKSSIYYEFKSRNSKVLFYNNSYYPANGRKDFVKTFPSLKKEIQAYIKRTRFKASSNEQMITLTKRIHALLTNNNTGER